VSGRSTPRHFTLEIARDRVLRIELQRGVNGGHRLVELSELDAATRETRPCPLVRRCALGQLFVRAFCVRPEIATLRKVDCLLLER
jgi:hypothetical protein